MNEKPSLQGQITLHQQKSKQTYSKIEGCIDKMIQFYQTAQQSIQEGKDQQDVIKELNQSLLNIKPVKTIREYQIHYYRKLSNLIKRHQSSGNKHLFSQSRFSRKIKSQIITQHNDQNRLEKKLQQFLNQFINKPEQIQAFDQIIVEYYLRSGRWECADVWPEIRRKIDPCNLFQESIRLKGLIVNGEFQQAIKWCQSQRLYQTHQNLLQYKLHKINTAKILAVKTVDQALNYYAYNFGKFHNQLQEIELLIGFILYKGKWSNCFSQSSLIKSQFQQRFSHLQYNAGSCLQLANTFEEEYFKHNSINHFNILKILYNCSQKISEDYYKLMRLMWDGQSKNGGNKQKQVSTVLPFSVKMEKEYQYHSLFLCPITKEVQSGNEKSILLSCGHLISSSAHSRILQQNRSRRKVKCPICQKEINHEQSLNIQF